MINTAVRQLYDIKKAHEYNIFKKLLTRSKVTILYSPLQCITQSVIENRTINSFTNVINGDTILKDNLKIIDDMLKGIENGQRQYFTLVKEIINNIVVYFVKMAKYDKTFKHRNFIFVTNSFKFFEMSKCKKFILMPDTSLINLHEADQTRRNSIVIGLNEIQKTKQNKCFHIETIEELEETIIKRIIKPKKHN